LVVLDGTLYTDEEMITQRLSDKTGLRMGHISMSGSLGSMAAFSALRVERRIYVHINNSNPVLRDDSPERAEDQRAGWEVAYDGMEIRLCAAASCRPLSWRPPSAGSVPSATTTSTRFITSCMAASSPRVRCRPGRSTASVTNRLYRARTRRS